MSGGTFRYAIAAVLVVGLSGALVYYLFNQPQKENAEQGSQNNSPLAARQPDPERFIPNQLLENFIDRNVRSASGTTLVSPKNGDTLTFPFTFSWNGGKRGDVFTLTIVDNKNVTIWGDSTSSTTILCTKVLEPGLYYCKLERNGILAQAGKFVAVKRAE